MQRITRHKQTAAGAPTTEAVTDLERATRPAKTRRTKDAFSAATRTAATRDRLLGAAGEIFAGSGFRGATVRDICGRAGTNIAAVNYHFGDKVSLYLAVLRRCREGALRRYPPTLGLGAHPTPRERLRAFVRSFLLRILDEGQPARYGRLMMKELADPTPALEHLVEEGIRPLFLTLSAIVKDLLGRAATPELVRLCSTSVVGQCLVHKLAQPVLARLQPEQRYDRAGIERLADHVTAFSLDAIHAAARRRRLPA